MAHVQHNARLNELLIALGKSLLQYVGQCSSWSSRSQKGVEAEFQKIVAVQQEHVAKLSALLTERRWTIDFGGFPADYTDLHFLSLNYLLKLIRVNQQELLTVLDEASHTCIHDPEASALISEILTSERELTERLNNLVPAGAKATV
ncbi:hypothetical protein [Schlesneria sp. T3-172]|uniref:hypothetical protein n=1 Tax=Schlesneria TaxID=656899 RepID=UPI002EE7D8A3